MLKDKKKWIINIKREGQLPKRAFVCEKHFTNDQFDNNRVDKKRPLRWDAVPTIFAHKKLPNPRKLPTVRSVSRKSACTCDSLLLMCNTDANDINTSN
ncbi:hypothetical protein NQ318_017419 [Aromia moschata]|uniref:THAP-type domain-containing protein n=1 Tax=Aromia moschata TaxID=1265417 RepID=A0AAV8Z3Z0_9CUCU|nr:hypothetical protein NQ318_017419 [Aromia moschata]